MKKFSIFSISAGVILILFGFYIQFKSIVVKSPDYYEYRLAYQ